MPKRDMDLIREILSDVERQPYERGYYDLYIPNYSEEEVSEHVRLAHDENLLEAINLSDTNGPRWRPTRLTSQGHDFLAAARNETFWNQAKERTKQKMGEVSLGALKLILAELVHKAMTSPVP